MTVQSVALGLRPDDAPYWLTTADVARMLELSRWGVLWLVKDSQLRCERTRSGQRLFRRGDVLDLIERRAKARGRGRLARLRARRVRMLKAELEPVQLKLFTPRRLRDITGERSLHECGVKRA